MDFLAAIQWKTCGFWTEWLDQAEIQQKELEKGKIETLSFFAFYDISMPMLLSDRHHNRGTCL